MQSIANRALGNISDLTASLIGAAERMERQTSLRWAVFISAAAASLFITGYHTGGFDQSIHIPFLKAWADPSLYPADPFVDLRFEHYSFFWFFFIPFLRQGSLEPAMFVVHVFSIVLTFWAVWRLSMTLFEDSLTSLIAVMVLAFPHIDFSGFPFIEFSMLNRSVVLPFVLLALDLFIRGRRLQAFTLLGVLYNLHVLSVTYTLIFMAWAEMGDVITSRAWSVLGRHARRLAAQGSAFLIAALPVFLWRLSSGASMDFHTDQEWISQVGNGILQNIYFPFSTELYVLATNLGGLALIFLFFTARRSAPSRRYDRTIIFMVSGGLPILLFQAAAARLFPVTFLMQLQLSRVSGLLLLLCILSLAHALAQAMRSRQLEGAPALLALSALVLSTLGFLLLPVWSWLKSRKPVSSQAAVTYSLVMLVAVPAAGILTGFWNPSIEIFPRPTAWLDVQTWARLNTPKEAMFITPPERYELYSPDWRSYSERATLATYTELLETGLAPSYLDVWEERIAALLPGELEWPSTSFIKNRRYLGESFTRLTEADLLRASCTYNASYLVVEKPGQYSFQEVYENSGFRVYELSCPK